MPRQLRFGRIYPVAMSLAEQSYFFKAEFIAQAPLNSKTGMTVDLVKMNKAITKILKQKTKVKINVKVDVKTSVAEVLQQIFKQAQDKLKTMGADLKEVSFHEERGFGIQFSKKNKPLIYRTDYGLDESRNLQRIISYFDSKGQLKKVLLNNLRENYSEEIY